MSLETIGINAESARIISLGKWSKGNGRTRTLGVRRRPAFVGTKDKND